MVILGDGEVSNEINDTAVGLSEADKEPQYKPAN